MKFFSAARCVFMVATLVLGGVTIHRFYLWTTGQGQADFVIVAGLLSLAFAVTSVFSWVRLEKPRD